MKIRAFVVMACVMLGGCAQDEIAPSTPSKLTDLVLVARNSDVSIYRFVDEGNTSRYVAVSESLRPVSISR